MFAKALGLFAALSAVATALPSGHGHAHHQLAARQLEARQFGAGNITSSGVEIINNLSETIYLWSVSDVTGPMVTLNTGEYYSENWRSNADGGGISIKISTSSEGTNILQFEYTYDPTYTPPLTWWDISLVNIGTNTVFTSAGFTVTAPNDPTCTGISCAPGDTDCAEVYLNPDDVATHACSDTDLLVLTLGA